MDEHDSDEWATDDRRLRLLEWLQTREGAFYSWGAKGEELPASAWQDLGLEPPDCRQLFDCSGLVTCAMHALEGPDWRHSHSAAKLFEQLEHVSALHVSPGDLVFYGQPEHVSHVMFVWDHGRVFGACNGNSGTVDLRIAKQAGARIRYRASWMYRPDVRGFRKFPFPPSKDVRNA